MEIERSDSIRVSFVQIADQTYEPRIEISGHTLSVASPIAVGTLSAPIQRAFGTEYDAYATASLAATSFDVKSVTSDEQSLEQARINWEWNLIPKNDGPQAINLSIEVRWKARGNEQSIRRQIWRTRLEMMVDKPIIATGQLSVLTLLTGLIGSGLSIPWIYERIKGINERVPAKKSKRGTRRGKNRTVSGSVYHKVTGRNQPSWLSGPWWQGTEAIAGIAAALIACASLFLAISNSFSNQASSGSKLSSITLALPVIPAPAVNDNVEPKLSTQGLIAPPFRVSLRADPTLFFANDQTKNGFSNDMLRQQIRYCISPLSTNYAGLVVITGNSPDSVNGIALAQKVDLLILEEYQSVFSRAIMKTNFSLSDDPFSNGAVSLEIYFLEAQEKPLPIFLLATSCEPPPKTWCRGDADGQKLIVFNWGSRNLDISLDGKSFQVNSATNGIFRTVGCSTVSPGIHSWSIESLGGVLRVEPGKDSRLDFCYDAKQIPQLCPESNVPANQATPP